MRETEGVLLGSNENMIHIRVWNTHGEEESVYINRHSCSLLSILDEGK